LQIKRKIISCHTAGSKPVKQEVNSTVILPPLVFLARSIENVVPEAASSKYIGLAYLFKLTL
jgi:hypothetical protein